MSISPNQMLQTIRQLYKRRIQNDGKGTPTETGWNHEINSRQLAEAIMDLDEWLDQGGVLPKAWETAIRPDDVEQVRGLTVQQLADSLKRRGIPVGEISGEEYISITDKISVYVGESKASAVYHAGNGVTNQMTPKDFVSELVADLEVMIAIMNN